MTRQINCHFNKIKRRNQSLDIEFESLLVFELIHSMIPFIRKVATTMLMTQIMAAPPTSMAFIGCPNIIQSKK